MPAPVAGSSLTRSKIEASPKLDSGVPSAASKTCTRSFSESRT